MAANRFLPYYNHPINLAFKGGKDLEIRPFSTLNNDPALVKNETFNQLEYLEMKITNSIYKIYLPVLRERKLGLAFIEDLDSL